MWSSEVTFVGHSTESYYGECFVCVETVLKTFSESGTSRERSFMNKLLKYWIFMRVLFVNGNEWNTYDFVDKLHFRDTVEFSNFGPNWKISLDQKTIQRQFSHLNFLKFYNDLSPISKMGACHTIQNGGFNVGRVYYIADNTRVTMHIFRWRVKIIS